MRNENDFKGRHNLTEHLVVLERSDLSDSPFFLWQFGWSVDLNAAAINQLIFTFTRTEGLLLKN